MAQKQIAARLLGDDYQARFFWYQATQLLFSDPVVALVKLEDGDAPYVDDVTVTYREPGRRDEARDCAADFFQVKFHVDQAQAYSAEGLVDPALIGSETKSLLQRFFTTFTDLRAHHQWFTLGLVSNWAWAGDDVLAKSIRHSGALPDAFFSAGARSQLGKVRERWRAHVEADDKTFREFAARLRLKLNYFGHGDFNAALNDRLHRAGLVHIDPTQDASQYDELARKFIVNGTTEFDAAGLRAVCEREGLLREEPPTRSVRRIGFRTFIPFAEVIESETNAFVCGADLFDGRHPKSEYTWSAIHERFANFVSAQRAHLALEHEVLLDCHASAALAAGYLITTRATAWPIGPRPGLLRQQPSGQNAPTGVDAWSVESRQLGQGPGLAIAVSVTHRTCDDVLEYVRQHGEQVGTLLEFVPSGGLGPRSVRDADHALLLIEALIARVRQERTQSAGKHLFIAAPNFFTFFLGQRLRALGEIVVYEYDFDGPEPREYHAAFRLPLNQVEAPEVRDGT